MTRVEIEEAATDCDLGRVVGPLDSLLDEEWETLHRFVEWASRSLRADRDRLAAEVEALRADAERLNSGCILTQERDEFGEPYQRIITGIDLRAAIDTAMKEAQ